MIRHFEKVFVIAKLNCVYIESSCLPFEFDLSFPNFPRAIGQDVKSSPTLALIFQHYDYFICRWNLLERLTQ